MKVAIFFGSQSDTDKMRGAANCLREFGIEFEAYVLSAHRVPEKLEEVLADVEKRGAEVIIAGGINNSYNSGMLAVQILAIKYPEIREKLVTFRKEMKAKFIADNEKKVEL